MIIPEYDHRSKILKCSCRINYHILILKNPHKHFFSVTEDDLDQLSTEIKIDFETYVQQTRNALTQQASDDLSFEYQVKSQGNNSINFIWKKYVPGNDIRVNTTIHLLIFFISEMCFSYFIKL